MLGNKFYYIFTERLSLAAMTMPTALCRFVCTFMPCVVSTAVFILCFCSRVHCEGHDDNQPGSKKDQNTADISLLFNASRAFCAQVNAMMCCFVAANDL